MKMKLFKIKIKDFISKAFYVKKYLEWLKNYLSFDVRLVYHRRKYFLSLI